MSKEPYGDKALWELEVIVLRSSTVSNKWLSKYKKSPAFIIIDGLVSSIKNKKRSDGALEYLAILVKEADGMYAEYLNEKMQSVMK